MKKAFLGRYLRSLRRRGNEKAVLNVKTADEQRGKDKLKQANRAKRKAAKKQRRKNR